MLHQMLCCHDGVRYVIAKAADLRCGRAAACRLQLLPAQLLEGGVAQQVGRLPALVRVGRQAPGRPLIRVIELHRLAPGGLPAAAAAAPPALPTRWLQGSFGRWEVSSCTAKLVTGGVTS